MPSGDHGVGCAPRWASEGSIFSRLAFKVLTRRSSGARLAIAVASATRPEQQYVSGPLADLPGLASGLAPGAPVVVILGAVARNAPAGILAATASAA